MSDVDLSQVMLLEWDKLIADTKEQLEQCPCKPWRTYLTNRVETLKAKKAEYQKRLGEM